MADESGYVAGNELNDCMYEDSLLPMGRRSTGFPSPPDFTVHPSSYNGVTLLMNMIGLDRQMMQAITEGVLNCAGCAKRARCESNEADYNFSLVIILASNPESITSPTSIEKNVSSASNGYFTSATATRSDSSILAILMAELEMFVSQTSSQVYLKETSLEAEFFAEFFVSISCILLAAFWTNGQGEAIRGNCDLSMILDALWKTKSRVDITNMKGLLNNMTPKLFEVPKFNLEDKVVLKTDGIDMIQEQGRQEDKVEVKEQPKKKIIVYQRRRGRRLGSYESEK